MIVSSPKTYLFVAILSLVLLSAFSFGPIMGMETDKDGQMSSCPFSEASSICKMGFSEHIGLWQSMFTAVVNNNASILALASMVILGMFATLKYMEVSQDKKFAVFKSYVYERQKTFTSNKLLELFSRGILNPKIYELAAI